MIDRSQKTQCPKRPIRHVERLEFDFLRPSPLLSKFQGQFVSVFLRLYFIGLGDNGFQQFANSAPIIRGLAFNFLEHASGIAAIAAKAGTAVRVLHFAQLSKAQ